MSRHVPGALRRRSDDRISILAGRFERILRVGDGVAAEVLIAEALDAGDCSSR